MHGSDVSKLCCVGDSRLCLEGQCSFWQQRLGCRQASDAEGVWLRSGCVAARPKWEEVWDRLVASRTQPAGPCTLVQPVTPCPIRKLNVAEGLKRHAGACWHGD